MKAQLWASLVVLSCMRRLTLLLALGVLLMASPTYAARPNISMPKCHLPGHSQMLTADGQAQVYETLETLDQEAGVFGCVFGRKRTYYLGESLPSAGTPEGSKGIKLEVLSGSVVAYQYGLFTPGFKEALIVVRNLRTGKILHRVPTGPSKPPSSMEVGPAEAIVLKSDGAVAWIVESNYEPSTAKNHYTSSKEYTVFALDRAGTRQLAAGRNIDPSSLTLAGSTLYWTQGGVPSSTRLN